jgi:divalent metal cation (Fe/Co/Zn/Cd) transporter
VVIWEAGKRLIAHDGHVVEATIWAFGVIIASIVVDFFRARALNRTATATSSHALAADALHFSSDLWASLAVLIGLAGVHFGFPWADSVAALAVAILVCIAGWRLGKRTIDTLTDVAPPGMSDKISAAAGGVRGVVSVNQVRAREVGDTAFIDLDVEVSRTMPLDRVNAVKEDVLTAIRTAVPGSEATVTTTPVALSNETVLERVMVIARNQTLAVHHVTVHEVHGRLSVSLDLEVDGKLTLAAAHAIADKLEDAITAELGAEVEVETHIEPLEPQRTDGREAPPERVHAVAHALGEIAAETRTVRDIHDVRVRETADGEIVNFHCRVDPALTVQDVHAKVDAVERALKSRSPQVLRVIGHAEPMA